MIFGEHPYFPDARALRTFRDMDEGYGAALALTCLGVLSLMRGDEGNASRMFEEGLAAATRRLGDKLTPTSRYTT